MTDGAASFGFDAIGTRWVIETDRPLSDDLRARIRDRIDRFDATWSRFRPDSLITRIAGARHGGRFRLPDDATVLLDLYDRLQELTDGALDPLIGRDLELLGYDATYSLTQASRAVRHREHQQRARWPDVQRDGTTIITDRPVLLDVGAAGKGRLVDLVELHGNALCASAVNPRAWGDGLHHILDARTGTPVRDVLATWIIADNAMLADVIATALFLTDPSRLNEAYRFAFVRMSANGIEASPGFEGELYD